MTIATSPPQGAPDPVAPSFPPESGQPVSGPRPAMPGSVDVILPDFQARAQTVRGPADLEELRIAFLGRKGVLNQVRSSVNVAALPLAERRAFGERFNQLKAAIEQGLEAAGTRWSGETVDDLGLDPTLPVVDSRIGALHPITAMQMEVEDIFRGMGFQMLDGDEAVTEFENFDALNIPGDHPARDMQDTFWLTNGMVLRTHTSALQNPVLRTHGAPIRAIFPGRCFRNEATDQTHENTFYQIEGLMVGPGISVANLIAVMKELLDKVFRRDIRVRLRPGFFPFVEPGFELDFWWRVGSAERWLELMPCGMVHRRVLEQAGLDPDVHTGFAFGLGLTRLTMLKFGIDDARLLNRGDLRFNSQFTATA